LLKEVWHFYVKANDQQQFFSPLEISVTVAGIGAISLLPAVHRSCVQLDPSRQI
jgi:hypothetical protein